MFEAFKADPTSFTVALLLGRLKGCEAGSKWRARFDNPFKRWDATVLEVKDGWVRYEFGKYKLLNECTTAVFLLRYKKLDDPTT